MYKFCRFLYKRHVVSHANSSLTLLFWNVGKTILTHNLKHKRAEYGKQIVVTVSRELVAQYGRNFEEKNLRRMIQFAETFSDYENVVTLSRHLSWSHFLVLVPIKTIEKRDFYGNFAFERQIGVRELRNQISKKQCPPLNNPQDFKIPPKKIRATIPDNETIIGGNAPRVPKNTEFMAEVEQEFRKFKRERGSCAASSCEIALQYQKHELYFSYI